MTAGDVYAERGFGGRSPVGRRPCLVVVDFSLGFTDPGSPLHCDCEDAVAATARLLDAARASGAPVVFTTVVYGPADLESARAFLAKAPALGELTRARAGSRSTRGSRRSRTRRCCPSSSPPRSSGPRSRRCSPPAGATRWSWSAPRPPAACVPPRSTPSSTAIRRSWCGRLSPTAQSAHDGALVDLDAKYADVISVEDALQRLHP